MLLHRPPFRIGYDPESSRRELLEGSILYGFRYQIPNDGLSVPYAISAKVTTVTYMQRGINTPEIIIALRVACFE